MVFSHRINQSSLLQDVDAFLELSKPQYDFLLSLNIIILVGSIIINPIVLYGSIRRQALKSDAITVLLLELLTGVDLVLTFVSVLPNTVTLFTRHWVFGPYFCVVIALATRFFYFNELIIIVFISLHRLKLVLAKRGKSVPMLRNQSEFRFKVVLGCLLTLPFISLTSSFTTSAMFQFKSAFLSCVPPVTLGIGWVILGVSLFLIAISVVIISNLIILIKILKIKYKNSRVMMFVGLVSALNPGTRSSYRMRKVRTSTMITVLMIFLFFIASYFPVLLIFLRDFLLQPLSDRFLLVATELLSLNVVVHPVVYTFTNRRFKQYLNSIIRCHTFDVNSKTQKTREDDGESSDKFLNETISKFFSSRRSSFASVRSLRSNHSAKSGRSIGGKRSSSVNAITSSDQHLNVIPTNGGGSGGKHHHHHHHSNGKNGHHRKSSACRRFGDIAPLDRQISSGSERSLHKQFSTDVLNIDTPITEVTCIELMENAIP